MSLTIWMLLIVFEVVRRVILARFPWQSLWLFIACYAVALVVVAIYSIYQLVAVTLPSAIRWGRPDDLWSVALWLIALLFVLYESWDDWRLHRRYQKWCEFAGVKKKISALTDEERASYAAWVRR
ncbi:hypothetical protein [Cupriavidus sp. TMH.W2]|uniref:hypothetical protein n=1 Tax=Cupriavidus sp. TMH.W2 TaxID=3434465 RepID=UPI003D77927A